MVHAEKLLLIADPGFRVKILEGAFTYAKGIILGTTVTNNDNIKRFSQIVVKEISSGGLSWADSLAYFTLSTPTALTIASTQAQVTTEVVIAFPYFAKAYYSDLT